MPESRGFEPSRNPATSGIRLRPHHRLLAGPTGLEPATFGVTGRRSNQLSYDPAEPVNVLMRARYLFE